MLQESIIRVVNDYDWRFIADKIIGFVDIHKAFILY